MTPEAFLEMNERIICGAKRLVRRGFNLRRLVICDKRPHVASEIHYDHKNEYGWIGYGRHRA